LRVSISFVVTAAPFFQSPLLLAHFPYFEKNRSGHMETPCSALNVSTNLCEDWNVYHGM
jgi:hypothetical protein